MVYQVSLVGPRHTSEGRNKQQQQQQSTRWRRRRSKLQRLPIRQIGGSSAMKRLEKLQEFLQFPLQDERDKDIGSEPLKGLATFYKLDVSGVRWYQTVPIGVQSIYVGFLWTMLSYAFLYRHFHSNSYDSKTWWYFVPVVLLYVPLGIVGIGSILLSTIHRHVEINLDTNTVSTWLSFLSLSSSRRRRSSYGSFWETTKSLSDMETIRIRHEHGSSKVVLQTRVGNDSVYIGVLNTNTGDAFYDLSFERVRKLADFLKIPIYDERYGDNADLANDDDPGGQP